MNRRGFLGMIVGAIAAPAVKPEPAWNKNFFTGSGPGGVLLSPYEAWLRVTCAVDEAMSFCWFSANPFRAADTDQWMVYAAVTVQDPDSVGYENTRAYKRAFLLWDGDQTEERYAQLRDSIRQDMRATVLMGELEHAGLLTSQKHLHPEPKRGPASIRYDKHEYVIHAWHGEDKA